MRIKSPVWLLPALLVIVCQSQDSAAAPWDNLLTFNRVEADPQNPYLLTDQNGPWTILACSFSGTKARQEAHDLVLEIRRRYKLPAYVYVKTFDFNEEPGGRGIDKHGAPLKLRYQRGTEAEEVAVMVGDYASVDDPGAQETRQRLKHYQPDCLKLEKNGSTSRTLAGLREIQKAILAPGNDKKSKGPMGHAFITTNPVLPKEFFVSGGIDKFVQEMNERIPHSLLDCRGNYTVQVAHFTGKVINDQKDIVEIENGAKMESRLVQAGETAERLAEALRIKHYEAYVFHDRYASLVTVGSFESVGSPRPDGKTEINPEIHRIIKTFGAKQTNTAGVPGPMQRHTLLGIPFDAQPIPVEVPKRSIGSDYSRASTAGMW